MHPRRTEHGDVVAKASLDAAACLHVADGLVAPTRGAACSAHIGLSIKGRFGRMKRAGYRALTVGFPPSTSVLRRISAQNLHPI